MESGSMSGDPVTPVTTSTTTRTDEKTSTGKMSGFLKRVTSIRKEKEYFRLEKVMKQITSGDVIELEKKKSICEYPHYLVCVESNTVVHLKEDKIVKESFADAALNRKARVYNGVITQKYSRFTFLEPNEVVRRANDKVGVDGQGYEHRWLNSEIFALWCCLGDQVIQLNLKQQMELTQTRRPPATHTAAQNASLSTTPPYESLTYHSRLETGPVSADLNSRNHQGDAATPDSYPRALKSMPLGLNKRNISDGSLVKFKIDPAKLSPVLPEALKTVILSFVSAFDVHIPSLNAEDVEDSVVTFRVSSADIPNIHNCFEVEKCQLPLAKMGVQAVMFANEDWIPFPHVNEEDVYLKSVGEGSLTSPRIVTGLSKALNHSLVDGIQNMATEIHSLQASHKNIEESLQKEREEKESINRERLETRSLLEDAKIRNQKLQQNASQMEGELTVKQKNEEKLQNEIKEREESLQTSDREKQVIKGRLQMMEKNKEEAENKLKNSVEKNKELNEEKIRLKSESEETKRMLKDMETENRNLKEELARLQAEIQTKNKVAEEDKKVIDGFRIAKKRWEKKDRTNSGKITDLDEKNKSLQEENDRLKEDNKNCSAELKDLTRSRAELEGLCDSVVGENKTLVNDRNAEKKQRNQLEKQRDELQAIIKANDQELEGKHEMLVASEVECEELNRKLMKMSSSYNELKVKVSEFEKDQARRLLNFEQQHVIEEVVAVHPGYQPTVTAVPTPEHGEEDATKEDDPLQAVFTFVAEELNSRDWKRLGRELGVRDGQLDEIESDHAGLYEQKYQMLRKWRETKGRKVTYNNLIKALNTLDLRYLGDQIKKKIPPKEQAVPKPGAGGPMLPNQEQPRNEPQKKGQDIKVYATGNKTARLLTDDLKDSLAPLNSFNRNSMIRIILSLKLNPDSQIQLQQSAQPTAVVSVLQTWENQTQPMEQDINSRRRLVYALIKTLREEGRKDVVDKIRENKGPGFVGATDPIKSISKMSFTLRLKLTQSLSLKDDTGADWRRLAEYLKIDAVHIQLWDQKNNNPGEDLLKTWQTRPDATIGNLYNILVDLGMPNSAGLLEE